MKPAVKHAVLKKNDSQQEDNAGFALIIA